MFLLIKLRLALQSYRIQRSEFSDAGWLGIRWWKMRWKRSERGSIPAREASGFFISSGVAATTGGLYMSNFDLQTRQSYNPKPSIEANRCDLRHLLSDI